MEDLIPKRSIMGGKLGICSMLVILKVGSTVRCLTTVTHGCLLHDLRVQQASILGPRLVLFGLVASSKY